jgi:hypothetical protein
MQQWRGSDSYYALQEQQHQQNNERQQQASYLSSSTPPPPTLEDAARYLRATPPPPVLEYTLTLGSTQYQLNPYDEYLALPDDATIRQAFDSGQLLPFDGLYLYVMKTAPSRTSWWRTQRRRLEHYISGPWHHPELVFWRRADARTGSPSYCAASVVYAERGVDVLEVEGARSYRKTSDYWTCIKLALTPEEVQRAYIFCNVQRGKPFNRVGYYCYYCAPMSWFARMARRQNEPAWTCSQLACQALISAAPDKFGNGVLDPLCTPSELWNIMQHYEHVVIDSLPGE